MTAPQVVTFAIFALVGLALIFLGVYAWCKPEFLSHTRRWAVGLAPALVIFGLSMLLFTADLVVTRAAMLETSINRWWFQAAESGALEGLLAPSMVLFFIGVLVFFWGPRDRQSPRRIAARLSNPKSRGLVFWQFGQLLVTVVIAIVAALAWFSLSGLVGGSVFFATMIGLFTIPVALVCAVYAYKLYARLVRKPAPAATARDHRIAQKPDSTR